MKASPSKVTSGRDHLVQAIHQRFLQWSGAGVPKYMQLRHAVVAAVQDRIIAPGDQLPPEDDLTAALGISLGTVRRALEHLSSGGVVTREHGRGTFVAGHQRAIDDSWHYRFLSEDGRSLLPVYSHILDREIVHKTGPWSSELGADPAGYVCIRRVFDVGREFQSYSEFYLSATRFGGILELPQSSLESVNLKKVLNDRFAAPTVYVEQRLRVGPFNADICNLLSIRRRSNGLFLQIVAHGYDRTPISYHMIYVPPTQHLLDLSVSELSAVHRLREAGEGE